MTIKEFAQIAAAIKTYFPRESILPTEKAMELWYMELNDLPYDTANLALRMYVATNKFPPTIADIRECAAKLSRGAQEGELNEMAAWQMVLKAMRNSIYHSEEEFAKLPPTVQKAVVSPGQLREWAMAEDIDGTWMNVTQSNFMRTYRVEVSREAEARKLSPDLLRLAGITAEKIAAENVEPKAISISEERIQAEKESVPMSEWLKEKYLRLMGKAV